MYPYCKINRAELLFNILFLMFYINKYFAPVNVSVLFLAACPAGSSRGDKLVFVLTRFVKLPHQLRKRRLSGIPDLLDDYDVITLDYLRKKLSKLQISLQYKYRCFSGSTWTI